MVYNELLIYNSMGASFFIFFPLYFIIIIIIIIYYYYYYYYYFNVILIQIEIGHFSQFYVITKLWKCSVPKRGQDGRNNIICRPSGRSMTALSLWCHTLRQTTLCHNCLTFNLSISVTWPLICAFHMRCAYTPKIIAIHRDVWDKHSAVWLNELIAQILPKSSPTVF